MMARVTTLLALCACPLGVLADPIGLTQGPGMFSGAARVVVPVDGTWFVLDELMSEGSFYAPIFSYTSATPVQMDVTDLFVVSDQNEVYLNGVLLGATPAMPDWSALVPAVGPLDDPPYTDDPDVAWLRPEFSKQSFSLPAGTHTLTLRNIHIPLDEDGNPFPDGTVAFRLVPEPTGGLLLLLAGACGLRAWRGASLNRRPRAAGRRVSSAIHGTLAAVGLLVALPGVARAGTPCGLVEADVVSGVLEIVGTAGADSVRVVVSSSDPGVVEIYTPVGAALPGCTFDSSVTPFSTIRLLAGDGDDLVVFDDSYGALSDTWTLEIDGGDGADIVFGGLDLSVVPLNDALDMIDTLQQAQDLIERVLDLLDTPQSGCNTVPCVVTNTAMALEDAVNNLVRPSAEYVRDIEGELVQPTAALVREAHERIATHLQIFMAGDAVGLAADAQAFSANVEVMVDEFELLLPVAYDLLARAELLYAQAANMGLFTQSGDAINVFTQTIESHILTITELAELCAEDPEPTETEFDENLQDPSGLSFWCAELERRIEALEAITDGVETRVDQVEAQGDLFEADGNAFEQDGELLGDDENSNSSAAQIEAEAETLNLTADAFSAAADAVNADWEQWVTQAEADLEGRGELMHDRGLAEVLAAADALHAQIQVNVEDAADALRAEAEQILADLNALMLVAAPLLQDGRGERGGPADCQFTTTHTIQGGPGVNVLIGTTGNDLIIGGSASDLIIGGPGSDRIRGQGGIDLLFGGGGHDEIFGGPGIDLIIGNGGNDCLYGGGGQTITRGSLTVELGDLFFGGDGNDTIVSGDSEEDELTEIDVVFAGAGDDRVRVSHGGTLTVGSFSFQFGNLVLGGDGNDDIVTGDGVDVLFGENGNDVIKAGKGALLTIGSGSNAVRLALGDLVFGGRGNDTLHGDDPDADRADDDIDLLFGGAGNDAIFGYGGGLLSIGPVTNPNFELGLGNLLFGGDGDDAIVALDGIDIAFGGDGHDTITAGKGALLTIGSGNDEFRLALGDLLFGGDGNDTLHGDQPSADRADDDIDVIFGGDGDDAIFGYGGGLLSIGAEDEPDFELRLGNVIFGGAGADNIKTLAGIDLIFAGADDDTVAAGQGAALEIDDDFSIELGDLIFGQAGNDTLHGDAATPTDDGDGDGIDLIFGGPGDDAIYGGAGGKIELPDQNFCLLFGNLLFGGPGDDLLRGDYSNWDPAEPQGGIDLIFGAAGHDTIQGGGGSLIIIGDLSAGQAIVIAFGNLLFGGPGDDVIQGADGTSACTGVHDELDDLLDLLGITDLGGAADLIFAGAGDDTVDAYNGIDFVFGSSGDDVLRADHGGILIVPISGPVPIAFGNLMFGGDGEDALTSLGRLVLPTVPPMEIDLLFGGPCDDVISAGDGFNLVFGNRADDTITAGNGINLLFGNRGADTIAIAADTALSLNVLFGNQDDDVLTGGDGINVMFGNRGDDVVTGGTGLTVAFGNRGNDLVSGGNGIGILFGNTGHDTVLGGIGLTVAFGNRGNDVVQGGPGLAVLFGNAGEDDVAGGPGLCVAFGNSGHDLVSAGAGLAVLFGNAGQDRLRSGSGVSVLFGNGDEDILEAGGSGLFVAFGNGSDDVLVGGGGVNLLFGNRGNDQFFGGGGMNIAFGNRDNDVIRGGAVVDFLFGNAHDDLIAGGDSKDFIFGNAGNDSLVGEGGGDYVFGNRGNDTVRSGSDGSTRDWLFGNRGNDALFGCSNADKLFGGRGNDSKDRENCGGLTLPPPARGEIRGTVRIDLDGDGVGDIPHAGVTVSAGTASAVTDADGNYRIAGLAVGGYTVAQTVPNDYMQVSAPATYAVTVGAMGIDLFVQRNFVNRANCYVAPDAWSCLGGGCDPAQPGCQPIVVRRVLRCPETGAICNEADDCPCSDCVPSWAVEECACNPTCYIVLDPATGPQCAGQCIGGGGVFPCELVQEGDLFRCECAIQPPCPTELARFRFSGEVTSVNTDSFIPPPWDAVQVGDPWTITYWFARNTPDQNPSTSFGNYPAIVGYQLQIGPGAAGGMVPPGATMIENLSFPGSADVYNVLLPLSAAGPPPTFTLLLEDPTGVAWTLAGLAPRDALPLCGDIVLDRFDARFFTLGWSIPGTFWQITGTVMAHDCTNCAPPPPPPPPSPAPRRPSAPAALDAPVMDDARPQVKESLETVRKRTP